MLSNQMDSAVLTRTADGWRVEVTKSFALVNGGGTHTFTEHVHNKSDAGVHYALDAARRMVTLSPAQNPASAPVQIHTTDTGSGL